MAAAIAVGQRFPAETEIHVAGLAAAVAVEGGLPHDVHAVGSFKRMPAVWASEGEGVGHRGMKKLKNEEIFFVVQQYEFQRKMIWSLVYWHLPIPHSYLFTTWELLIISTLPAIVY